jgi:D-galactarolactone cycloisomerase
MRVHDTHDPSLATEVMRPVRIAIFVLRAPLEEPVVAAIGRMTSRPAVLLRIEDAEGAFGWGEVFCNFPTCGAEHRGRLLAETVVPALFAVGPAAPAEAWPALSRRLHNLALQAGEPGPVAQCLAGIDIALWDLAARRAGLPLWRMLGGARTEVPAYASGIDPRRAPEVIGASRSAGHCRFKVKIGFGRKADLQAVEAAHAAIGPGESLMLDANQAWDAETALETIRQLAAFAPTWLEEPIPADRPADEWRSLAALGIPLAAGENLRGTAAFDAALKSGTLAYVQPDACKWGGITGCLPLARRIIEAGASYCPHYLGGAVGLLASAHLLAAAGGPGWLEMDAQDNPLRSGLCGAILPVTDGVAGLPDGPGLGAEPIGDELARRTVWQTSLERG